MSWNIPQKVDNAFDPSVSGLVAPVGSGVESNDGTKAWIKWGTGNTQWTPLHPVTTSAGVLKTNFDTTDLIANLACDTLGGVEVVWQGSVTAAGYLAFRVNGASAATSMHYVYINSAAGAFVKGNDCVISDNLVLNTAFTATITCKTPLSGSRFQLFELNSQFVAGASVPSNYRGSLSRPSTVAALPVNEIQSVGIFHTAGAKISATTTMSISRI